MSEACSVYSSGSVPRSMVNAPAENVMTPAPNAIATHTARRMAFASPAPIRLPTRALAPIEMPSGTMKVSDARLSAIWCAADGLDSDPADHERRSRERERLEPHLRTDRNADPHHARETRERERRAVPAPLRARVEAEPADAEPHRPTTSTTETSVPAIAAPSKPSRGAPNAPEHERPREQPLSTFAA